MAEILKFVYIIIIFLFITEIKGDKFVFDKNGADRCRSILDCPQDKCFPLLTLVCVNFACDCLHV
ncbi:Nodule Cysteine-Rich (NCR) secreted peptide [Medicago truncatula]|uniref:Nodule Cysteine-Rich (NCR) secreted peptide n=1 Tax=Medicago truncatula TaxID=3880 RepID=G7JJW3_MEDTR|nr:Nodule Cysteine-Rich (NCR) secreted peptide [Medicago truncatula]